MAPTSRHHKTGDTMAMQALALFAAVLAGWCGGFSIAWIIAAVQWVLG